MNFFSSVNCVTHLDRFLELLLRGWEVQLGAAWPVHLGNVSGNEEDRIMSGPLAGQTITVTAKKSLNTDEMAKLIVSVFGATGCRTCTSGGHFVLREELELPVDPALDARAVIT
jgi:hypothetical protein